MLKWVLAGFGFLAGMAAIFIAVVMFLFSGDDEDTSSLTELHSARAVELTDIGSAYRVVYEYSFDGHVFYGKETVSSKDMSEGSTFAICLDPNDPVRHSLTYTDCGPDGPVHLQEGLEERPDL